MAALAAIAVINPTENPKFMAMHCHLVMVKSFASREEVAIPPTWG
jgi:hypothetical protein